MKIKRSIIFKILPLLVLAGCVFTATMTTTTAQSQAPAAAAPAPKDGAALLKLIAAQQDEMAANHKKLEEKLAAIEEEVRKANIYVSRGGSGKGK